MVSRLPSDMEEQKHLLDLYRVLKKEYESGHYRSVLRTIHENREFIDETLNTGNAFNMEYISAKSTYHLIKLAYRAGDADEFDHLYQTYRDHIQIHLNGIEYLEILQMAHDREEGDFPEYIGYETLQQEDTSSETLPDMDDSFFEDSFDTSFYEPSEPHRSVRDNEGLHEAHDALAEDEIFFEEQYEEEIHNNLEYEDSLYDPETGHAAIPNPESEEYHEWVEEEKAAGDTSFLIERLKEYRFFILIGLLLLGLLYLLIR